MIHFRFRNGGIVVEAYELKGIDSSPYEPIIRKIRNRKRIAIILAFIAVIVVFALSNPIYVVIANQQFIQYDGIGFGWGVLLFLAVLLIEFVAMQIVYQPLQTSMTLECDPEKNLVLNYTFNKRKYFDQFFTIDYLYLGDYETSLFYARRLTVNSLFFLRVTGLYFQSQGAFFSGNVELLKESLGKFDQETANPPKLNRKQKESVEKYREYIEWMIALSENNVDRVKEFKNFESQSQSVSAEGMVNYLKGLSASLAGDTQEAVYRFKSVIEKCGKTGFAKSAKQKLEEMENGKISVDSN